MDADGVVYWRSGRARGRRGRGREGNEKAVEVNAVTSSARGLVRLRGRLCGVGALAPSNDGAATLVAFPSARCLYNLISSYIDAISDDRI